MSDCRGLFLAAVLLRGVDSLKYTKTPLTSWGSSQLLGRFCVAKGLGKSSADLRVKVELTYPLLAQGVRVILHSGDRTSYTKAFIRGTCAEQHAAANVLLGTGRTLSEPIFDGSTMKRRFMNSEQNKLVVENSTQWWSIDGVQSSGEVSVRNAYPSAAAVNSTHWAVNYEVSLKSSGYSTLPITDTDKFIYAVLVNCDPEQCALNRPCYGALQGVSVTAELRSSAAANLDHFSCDQSLVFVATTIFFWLHLALGILMVVFLIGLQLRSKLHWTVFLPFGAQVTHTFGLLLAWVHYTVYSVDGRGSPALECVIVSVCRGGRRSFVRKEVFHHRIVSCVPDDLPLLPPSLLLFLCRYLARFFYAMASTCTLTLLLLLALGYTTVRKDLKTRQWLFLIVFLIIYAFGELGCLVWLVVANSDTESEAVYLYDTAPGYVVCGLRVLAALMLSFGICSTMRWSRFRKKRKFHVKLFIIGFVWVSRENVFISSLYD